MRGRLGTISAMIAVCPITRLQDTAAAHRADRMISILSDSSAVRRPQRIAWRDHLVLRFHDIVEPLAGYVSPSAGHVAEALAFAAADDRPLLVHCYAGVSRSTAMAFAIACAREPLRDEFELAQTMRELSPTATPNRLIVALADEALGRGGRMAEAVAAIGRGRDAFEGEPFVFSPLTVTPTLLRQDEPRPAAPI